MNTLQNRDYGSAQAWGVWLLATAIALLSGIRVGCLALFLFGAVLSDLDRRKIPNRLILFGSAIALLCQTLLPDGLGSLAALQGFGLGLLLLLPLYVLRAMGAGDVKLMAMVGAYLGPEQIIGAALGTMLAGGLLSVAFALRHRVVRKLFHNIRFILLGGLLKASAGQLPRLEQAPESLGKLPYALAIATGTLAYLCLPLFRQLLA